VNSQVFDHTSVIRFMEQRFGVMEPNISAWRRAVCGDLTSALDFSRPNRSSLPQLPATAALAARARALPARTLPAIPAAPVEPRQTPGTRPARALPYQLHVHSLGLPAAQALQLEFANSGSQAAVFHVYDRLNLAQIPRRYTVEPGRRLVGTWALAQQGRSYDLWLLGPNGFHRHFTGQVNTSSTAPRPDPEIEIGYDLVKGELTARLHNSGRVACSFELQANAYFNTKVVLLPVAAQSEVRHSWQIQQSGYWYDFTLRVPELAGFRRRFAGRMETGQASITDPAQDSGQ
jgi:phospholipase C